ncbi:hypothetical protein M8C21_012456 [Ambrosia artemisiifolia]|uniref:Uncharacterized protein n=1 Tax=Ambrosia artemisiifolia TaxID=4212 RepID=A0AAD5CZ55_AMBAR|nr:hypothetical protein M8C21_012456 [Ambrosia artemisiifolia]
MSRARTEYVVHEQHGFTFNFKTMGKEMIAKMNLVVKAARLMMSTKWMPIDLQVRLILVAIYKFRLCIFFCATTCHFSVIVFSALMMRKLL